MSLVFDWTVTIDGIDVSAFVLAAGTIDYGRQGKGNAFSAPRAMFDMLLPEANPNPAPGTFPTLEKWQSVVIHVTWDGTTQWRRFTGRIQALDFGRFQVMVTATGNTVDYAKFPAGETHPFAPRSVEADIDRVEWLAQDAPWPLTVEGAPGRRIRQIERNSPSQPLLDALVRIAEDCNGLLLEDRLGVPHFRSRNFTFPARYTLPHAVVDTSSLALSTDAGDVVTTVRVYYGEPSTETGLQDFRSNTNSALNVTLGYDVQEELYTDLRTPEGADGRAEQYLLERGDVFYVPDVPLLMSACSGAEADDILDLQEGWPVTIETLPEGWPVSSIDCDVVGFTEVMHQTDYRIILHLEPSIELNDEDDSDPIYPDDSLTGYDATGTEEIDDKTYRWCRWDESGAVTNVFTESAMFVLLCAIAQGGNGGVGGGLFGQGGYGGAGGFINEHIDLNPGTWPVVVGDDAANDGDTVFYGTRLYRGGDGGSTGDGSGHDGGSGGGAHHDRSGGGPSGPAGEGVLGQGYDGYEAGGGAAGPATANINPGPGAVVDIGGSSQTFGVGGVGTPDDRGSGGQGSSIVQSQVDGSRGVVYLRYRIG